jgi:hypothetical protein
MELKPNRKLFLNHLPSSSMVHAWWVLVHSGQRTAAAAGPVLAIPFWGDPVLFLSNFFLCSFSGNSYPHEDLKKNW